ncbi:MAG: class D sortase [Bryobacterales bacterium]|nr:class D sortase [Bryobacterales bacterium]
MKRKNLISLFLIVPGFVLLAWSVFRILSMRETVETTREWLRETAARPSASPVWLGANRSLDLPEGEPLGMLSIESVQIEAPVFAGDGKATLSLAAGWIKGTALPGSRGNAGIAAHRDTLFRPLRNIKRGDAVVYRSLAGSYTYRVVWTKIVRPSDVSVLDNTVIPSLTLVSCYPFYYVGPAPYRFIVRAEASGLSPPPQSRNARVQ